MQTPTMQAVLVDRYGEADVLELRQTERPQPQAGEVLVRLEYTAVIPLDWKIRRGWLKQVFPITFPYIPGFYASGTVEAAGEGVTEFQAGDRVLGQFTGAYAEFAVAKKQELVKVPDSLSLDEAAAVRGGADSAWKALFTEGELQSGQTVLIHAAAGGVGQFAVQLAKWKGATVIGTASASNLEFVKSLGADRVIDYRSEKFDQLVQDVDLVVDTVGGETQERSWKVLKQGGMLVSLFEEPDAEQAAAHGATGKFNTKFSTRDDLLQIVDLIANGTLKTQIDSIYPIGEVQEAHRRSETRSGRGRILLSPRG
ncbi:NADP-dependent oxidoreductase [Saccharibacillus sp. CPCC 101409]|uniref:NADP-dependent oxidoreductase n=1 Tax=Saccharibacillus sp. CPCC 101409 TaxID=3058041 RepID=UPI0026712BDF|nr:NADP-dependent oxidoreductase [Saccharibacillus sp. CPCC 101409]MDO3408402.1 NADP-dependent oxidoreductase [Saccharibacillus sp. CPCC 101409]